MTRQSLTSVLIAVLGVFFVARAISEASTGLFFLSLDSADDYIQRSFFDRALLTFGFIVLQFGLGSALILLRFRLAVFLFPNDSSAELSTFEATHLQSVLFSVVGIFLIVEGIASLASGFAQLSPDQPLSYLWAPYLSDVIKTVFGILLFFGARSISQIWFRARRAGHNR